MLWQKLFTFLFYSKKRNQILSLHSNERLSNEKITQTVIYMHDSHKLPQATIFVNATSCHERIILEHLDWPGFSSVLFAFSLPVILPAWLIQVTPKESVS